MMKTLAQLRDIHAKLKQLKIDDDARYELVLQVTNERTSSCAQLTYDEAEQLRKHLANLVGKDFSVNPALDKKRKRVLSAFHEMGYRIPGTMKLDMKKVNETIVKYGYLHKSLNEYSIDELSKLIEQTKKMRDHNITSKYKNIQS